MKIGMVLSTVTPKKVETLIRDETSHEAKIRELQQQKFEAEQELQLAKLTEELEMLRATLALRKKPSIREKLETEYAERRDELLAVDDIFERELLANAEKYKNNPVLLQRANEQLEDWREQRL